MITNTKLPHHTTINITRYTNRMFPLSFPHATHLIEVKSRLALNKSKQNKVDKSLLIHHLENFKSLFIIKVHADRIGSNFKLQ